MATAVLTEPGLRPISRSDVDDRHGWGFALLLMVVATLCLRPADLVPALDQWPIYQYLIVGCLIVSARGCLRHLSQRQIIHQPATASLLLLLLSVGLSHAAHGFFWGARMSTYEVSKVLALYLLVVALVNSPRRLTYFVNWFVASITTIATLALLDFRGIISIPALESIRDRGASATGQADYIERIRGTGIFQDPNDFGLVLVVALIFTAARLLSPRAGWTRYVWLLPGGILLTTLAMTHSRGAFLALACGIIAALVYARNWRWSVLAVIAIPILTIGFSARTTDLNAIVEGTGQTRIQIWSQSLTIWKQYPLFGLGEGLLVEELGVVAHNSFLQCFAELGVIGGAAFVGCFLAAGLGLWSLRERGESEGRVQRASEWRQLDHFRVFMFSALAAYAAGMCSISRQFVMPTYLMLGLATATHTMRCDGRRDWKIDNRFLLAASLASVGMLFFTQLAVRVFVRW